MTSRQASTKYLEYDRMDNVMMLIQEKVHKKKASQLCKRQQQNKSAILFDKYSWKEASRQNK